MLSLHRVIIKLCIIYIKLIKLKRLINNMSQANDQKKHAIELNLSIISQISEICKPLDQFNITCFGMVRIFNSGKWLVTGNHQAWVANFIEKIQSNHNYLKTIEKEIFNNPQYIMYGHTQKDLEIESYREMHSFNLWNGLNIYNNHHDFIEYYYILSKPEIQQMNNFYINNLETLKKYTVYFKSKLADLIDLNDEQILFSVDKVIDIESIICKEVNDHIKKFIKEITLDKYILNLKSNKITLTSRQFECVLNFIEGLSMKEIGKKLNISHRTVEYYINIAKSKMGIRYKNELKYILKNIDTLY